MPTKNLIPAVSYVRMSSDKQEESPDRQREENKRLAEANGCRIIREYLDEGISGDKTSKRADFQRMVRDAAEKGDFACIIVWDTSRFGRFDSIEAGYWIHPLRQAGVWLLTKDGKTDWNDFSNRLIYNIRTEQDHQFLLGLSKNVLSGKLNKMRAGRSAWRPCWGFDRLIYDERGEVARRVPYGEKFTTPKGWRSEIVPSDNQEIVSAVVWVFETFASSDCSVRSMVVQLNALKPPGTPAKGWTDKGLRYILQNPVYIGHRPYGRRPGGKFSHVGQGGAVETGPAGKDRKATFQIDNAHKPLIDVETFDRVQARLAAVSKGESRPRHSRYLLAGVMRCGHCGGPLTGTQGQANCTTNYYRCRRKANGEAECPSFRIRQDQIEDYVICYVRQRLFAPESQDIVRRKIHEQAKAQTGYKTTTDSLKARITAMDKKIAKGTENLLLANAEDMVEMSRLLAGWRREREEMQARLETVALNPTGKSADELVKKAQAELARLRRLFDSGDPAKVRMVFKSMIESITIFTEAYHGRGRVVRGVLVPKGKRVLMGSRTECGLCPSA